MPFRRLFFVIGFGFFAFVGKAQSEEEIYSLLDDTVPARAAVTTMRQHAPGVVLAESYVQPKVQDIAKASVNSLQPPNRQARAEHSRHATARGQHPALRSRGGFHHRHRRRVDHRPNGGRRRS
jgi:hypothetical protein